MYSTAAHKGRQGGHVAFGAGKWQCVNGDGAAGTAQAGQTGARTVPPALAYVHVIESIG
jgi:hypothetical protein